MNRQFKIISLLSLVLAGAALLAEPAEAVTNTVKIGLKGQNDLAPVNPWLEGQVRHELIMLPYYGVFDNLMFKVDGDRVELSGQVNRPTLKSAAERVVGKIEGVEEVVNNIEVLPVSFNDDRIRLAVYRSIFGNSVLQRYRLGSVPSIHIIVKNGNVTLEGVVANEMDKNVANLQANGVSGVFSVANNLVVAN
jgi:hyperosmotically inducible protein